MLTAPPYGWVLFSWFFWHHFLWKGPTGTAAAPPKSPAWSVSSTLTPVPCSRSLFLLRFFSQGFFSPPRLTPEFKVRIYPPVVCCGAFPAEIATLGCSCEARDYTSPLPPTGPAFISAWGKVQSRKTRVQERKGKERRGWIEAVKGRNRGKRIVLRK